MNIDDEELKKIVMELIKDKLDQSDVVILTPEEVSYVKELIADRKAMGRVFTKGKMIILAILGILVATTDWLTKMLDLFLKWMSS